MASLHVSISAETLTTIAGVPISNSMLTGLIVSAFLIIGALTFAMSKKQIKKVSRLQSLVELIIEGIYNLNKDIAGEKKARIFLPLIATFIIFILFNNWAGLLPGVGTIGLTHESDAKDHQEVSSQNQVFAATESEVAVPISNLDTNSESDHSQTDSEAMLQASAEDHSEENQSHTTFVPLFRAATADLNTTLALALISVFMTQYYGVQYLGLSYFTKFFNFKQGPIFTFVGILELISEVAKIISYAFRLFGNIFAGEVLLAVIAFLIPLALPIPFIGLEIFVGLIQAVVFGMLTLVFTNMATVSHDDH